MKTRPSLEERLAAAKAKREALEAKVAARLAATESKPTTKLPEGWVFLGTCPITGKPRYRTARAIAERIPSFAEKLAGWLKSKRTDHVAGGTCPHCNGTGRYRFHSDPSRNEKCFRCDGKGTLNTKDLAYLDRRLGGAGPVCWVVSAAAA